MTAWHASERQKEAQEPPGGVHHSGVHHVTAIQLNLCGSPNLLSGRQSQTLSRTWQAGTVGNDGKLSPDSSACQAGPYGPPMPSMNCSLNRLASVVHPDTIRVPSTVTLCTVPLANCNSLPAVPAWHSVTECVTHITATSANRPLQCSSAG